MPKPPSKIAFEPLALAEAMHSEMGRPERFGGLIVAYGPVVTLHDHFHAFLNLRQDGIRIAGEIGVANVERSHMTMILR